MPDGDGPFGAPADPTARTLIASVIRPSIVIASASSNGSQRTASSSVPLGAGHARRVRPVARKRTAISSETEFERCDPGELAPIGRGRRRSPRAARAGRRRARVSPGGHAALRDLPRIVVERVAVLADQQDPVVVVDATRTPAARFAKWTTP